MYTPDNVDDCELFGSENFIENIKSAPNKNQARRKII